MNLTQRYIIDKDNVTYRIIDDEAVILNLDSGYYYSLNKVGTAIWQMLEKGMGLTEALGCLKKEYQVEEKQLRKDIVDLIKDLYKEGLLKRFK